MRSNPGVATDRGDTEGRSLALSIYGATSAENQWIIDGVNTTNVFKGMQGKAINNEFVQEVEVKTGGYQAEYGRALGGVVNVITKSGGNEFHGDGFVYYDSTGTAGRAAVRARRLGPRRRCASPTTERFDYGADLGGFLLKDRLWFFGAYNRVSSAATSRARRRRDLVPTEDRFPLDTDGQPLLREADLERRDAHDDRRHGLRRPVDEHGRGGADPRQGSGRSGRLRPNPDPSTWYSRARRAGTDFGLRLQRSSSVAGDRDAAGLVPPGPERPRADRPDCIRYGGLDLLRGRHARRAVRPPGEPNSVDGGYGWIFGPIDHSKSHREQIRARLTLYAGNHEIKVGGDYQDGQTDALTSFSGRPARHRRCNEYGQTLLRAPLLRGEPRRTRHPCRSPRSATTRDFGVYLQDSWKAAPA